MTNGGRAEPTEAWSLEFARPDGTGGFVRLARRSTVVWYWAYVVSPELGLIVVRDHDVPPPRAGALVVRADGLWAELVPETPGEHWTVGLEAFGVRLDDPLDAEHGERGERLPVGLDLEWEVGAETVGRVHGEVLAGRARVPFDGTGAFEHTAFTGDPWAHDWRRLSWQRDDTHGWTARDRDVTIEVDPRGLPRAASVGDLTFMVRAVAVVPVGVRLVRALVTSDEGHGWLEWCPGGSMVRTPAP